MTNFKLKDIEIKSFRGIKNYTLDFNNKSLVLVGENGSGKSSIVNAFEFLFTGKVESLSGKQAIKHDTSLVHIGDNPEDLSVKANINNSEIRRTLQESPEDNDIIYDFKNGSFLLNRQKLLSFINKTPKGKYDRITSLIDFGELDEIETTLNRTQKSFKNKLKLKKEELDKKIESITDIYNYDLDKVYDKINETLVKNDLEQISSETNLKRFLKDFSKKDFEKTNQLSDLINLIDVDVESVAGEFEKLLENYEKSTLYELKSTNNLISILNKSSDYLEVESPENCPLCGKKIEPKQVLNRISREKKQLSENERTLKDWKNDYKQFSNRLNNLNSTLNTIENILADFKEYEFRFSLDELISDLDKLASFEIPLSKINSNALIELDDEFTKLKQKIESDFDKLNDIENQNELNNVYDVIYKLLEKETLESEVKIVQKEFDLASQTYELFKTRKQKALEETIEKIQSRVSQYYNFIHEDEEFNTPQIKAPKSSGISLDLNFKEIIADPRSYSSEGHLDSLGLCIFLAFAKEFNEYEFIILDDIISTVDLGHKERVATLLLTEFKDYQIILTTHNKLWFRQLKNYVHNYKLGNDYIFAEIRHLDSATGPNLTRNMFSKELIDKYIEFGDTFAAGNAIRRYLEYVCERVCRINQIPIPLKEHYMVDDYMRVIKPYFLDSKLLKSSDETKTYYEKVLNILDSSRYMGNILSHDDDANLDVTLNEVVKFRDAVMIFERSMQCWQCNAYLKFNVKEKKAECSRERCLESLSFKPKNG